MKQVVCFFFLLIGIGPITFAQSPKKLNKQLRAQLLLEKQKQDSGRAVFYKEQPVLGEARLNVGGTLKRSIDSEQDKVKDRLSRIRSKIYVLSHLEVNYSDVLSDGTKTYEADLRAGLFTREVNEALHSYLRFYPVPLIDSNLENLKIKEQNEVLKLAILKHQDYWVVNLKSIENQRSFIRELVEFAPRLDSVLKTYQLLNRELGEKDLLLKQKWEAAREHYRLKGPKGFPEAYRSFFPEIHPKPKPKHAVEELAISSGDQENELSNAGFLESEPVEETSVSGPLIYEVVEEPAEFPGGMSALKKYLAENLIFPPVALENEITGKVYLRLTISDTGVLSEVTVMKGIPDCTACDEEAVRVVKTMPRWIPGKVNGKAVNSYFSLPIFLHFN